MPQPLLVDIFVDMPYSIPDTLANSCRETSSGTSWLASLPNAVDEVINRWSLRVVSSVPHPAGTAALVLFVQRADDSPAVLKMGRPHMEAEDEAHGLRLWDGDPTVRLLETDEALNALLLERCIPGTALSSEAEAKQDVVITTLLRRLWQTPTDSTGFRPLETMLAEWEREVRSGSTPADRHLVDQGFKVFSELCNTTHQSALLATDLHAGNVLRSQREPWLVIDPKPFVGDPAYDLVQHLLNCRTRLRSDPWGTVRRVASLAGQDANRVGSWVFARIATGTWATDDEWTEIARHLAP